MPVRNIARHSRQRILKSDNARSRPGLLTASPGNRNLTIVTPRNTVPQTSVTVPDSVEPHKASNRQLAFVNDLQFDHQWFQLVSNGQTLTTLFRRATPRQRFLDIAFHATP